MWCLWNPKIGMCPGHENNGNQELKPPRFFFLPLVFALHSLSPLASFFIPATDQLSSWGSHGKTWRPIAPSLNSTFNSFGHYRKQNNTHKKTKNLCSYSFWFQVDKSQGGVHWSSWSQVNSRESGNNMAGPVGTTKMGIRERKLLEEEGWGEVLGKQSRKHLWHLLWWIFHAKST